MEKLVLVDVSEKQVPKFVCECSELDGRIMVAVDIDYLSPGIP
jgi:hypothetical protein